MRKGAKVLIIISIIVLVLALLFVCYQLFRVRAISVVGGASADYVKSLSGINIGDSTFLVDKQAAFEQIEAEPWIKAVNVEIIYPDKIKIEAEQRQIEAYVIYEDVLLAIDGECTVLSAGDIKEVDMPLVRGLQMDVFEVGKTIGCGDRFMLNVTERVLKELGKSTLDIKFIDVSLAANIVLETKQGMSIEIGDDTNLSAKLKLASATIKELELSEKNIGILDVSAVSSAYYRAN